MSEKLKWPKEPNLPDRPGWWWVRTDDGREEFIVLVSFGGLGRKPVLSANNVPVIKWGPCKWAGPIEKPEEL